MNGTSSINPVLPARLDRRTAAFRAAVFMLIALLVVEAGRQGLRLRRWVWDTTAPIRFTSDLDRGFEWGRIADGEGLLNQYEKMQFQRPADRNWMDYGPLRLVVMTAWAKWARTHHPSAVRWHDERSYELTAPLLRVTLGTEIAAVVAAFFLVRLWVIRGDRPGRAPFWSRFFRRSDGLLTEPIESRPFFRGVFPGLVAAAVLWFNPATVLDGYGWPSYDDWVIPFFLLAVLAASLDFWFVAGLVIGTGAMLKGQMLLAVPVLAIWGLVAGKFTGAVRVVGGTAVAIAVVASPWLLTSIPAGPLAVARSHPGEAWQAPPMAFHLGRSFNVGVIVWVTGVAVLAATLPTVARWTTVRPEWKWRRVIEHRWFWPGVAAVVAFGWILWPWLRAGNRTHWRTCVSCAVAAAVCVVGASRNWWRAIEADTSMNPEKPTRPFGVPQNRLALLVQPVLIATATAMLLCTSVFNASTAWWDCGVRFGTEHWPSLEVGTPDNAPALLVGDFRWSNEKLDEPAMTLAARKVLWAWPAQPRVVPIGTLLRFIAGVGVLAASIGIGLQARGRDPRLLIAVVTPWVWCYCFTPQVQERYLVFAAGVACVCAGVSTGMLLIGIGLSVVAALSVLHVMMVAVPPKAVAEFQARLGAEFPRLFEKTGPKLSVLAAGTHPDIAWAVLLAAMIFLYFSLAIRRRAGTGRFRRWRGYVANRFFFGTVLPEAIST
jgi:hypothetical protein